MWADPAGHRLANPRPALVLFDLDGTLVDHRGAAASAVERWLLGAGWADREAIPALTATWEEVADRHFAAYRARRTTFTGQRRARLREFLPLLGIDADSWADERLDEAFAGYEVAYTAAWRAFDDVVPCLEALRDVAVVAVLSNGDQAQQEAKLARTGLAGLVGAVLTSDGLGVAKPDAGAFTAACERLGAPPGETAYVGDHLDDDARAASAAGLRGVWLDRAGADAPDLPADVVRLRTLAQLPALIEPRCTTLSRDSAVTERPSAPLSRESAVRGAG